MRRIARLVEGVTKFTKIERLSESENQAESFKKFFIATAGDVRVLLVKVADRLHNMRTLEHLRSAKKARAELPKKLLYALCAACGQNGYAAIKRGARRFILSAIYILRLIKVCARVCVL